MWGALRLLDAVRIGHGVRCLEDPALVAELRGAPDPARGLPDQQRLPEGRASRWPQHPLPRLLAEGLYVTLNSDDPAMFNTHADGRVPGGR